ISPMRRADRDASIIGQGSVERYCARCDFGDEALQPILRYEVEQRRCGDEIDRSVERGFQVVLKIERRGRKTDARGRWSGYAREQTEIVVDEAPALGGRYFRCEHTQSRAGAAGEIDDAERAFISGRSSYSIEHRRIACRFVVRFA